MSAYTYTATSFCRVCPGDVLLEPLMSLGAIRPSTFLDPGAADPPAIPLVLGACPACGLVQLMHTTDRAALFTRYWYRSGVNETMVRELRDIVVAARRRVYVGPQDTVLDIGANDGTLLGQYEGYRPRTLACEPSETFRDELAGRVDRILPEFFPPSPDAVRDLARDYPAGLQHIYTIAMLYDLDDPNAFVHAVKALLAPGGIWIIQFQDLLGMIRQTAFDNIVHEHLKYYTLHSLMAMLAHNGLTVYDVEWHPINGGSLRCYVGHTTPPPVWADAAGRQHVVAFAEAESVAGLTEVESLIAVFRRFSRRIVATREQLAALFAIMRREGRPVDGYGASTKGNTLLQVCGIGPEDLRQIAERSPAKVGKETVGTRIPIVSEDAWRADPAGITLSLIWQFRAHTLQRESAYLEAGGTLLFPLPSPDLVGQGGT